MNEMAACGFPARGLAGQSLTATRPVACRLAAVVRPRSVGTHKYRIRVQGPAIGCLSSTEGEPVPAAGSHFLPNRRMT